MLINFQQFIVFHIIHNTRYFSTLHYQARVRGGGPKGPGPPPLEIEKPPKKKVIRANIKLFHLYFATFLVENFIFSAIFRAGPPPPEKLKSKKKRLSDFGPPSYEFLDTRLIISVFCYFIHTFCTLTKSKVILILECLTESFLE